MPPRDPSRPQLDFPQLVADVIADLRLQGTIGLLDFVPSMQPVYIAASRAGSLEVVALDPVFEVATIFTDVTVIAAAASVLADTGQLPAGTYDVKAFLAHEAGIVAGVSSIAQLAHRNAANTANLSDLDTGLFSDGAGLITIRDWKYSTTLAENERIRFATGVTITQGTLMTTIMAKRRAVP